MNKIKEATEPLIFDIQRQLHSKIKYCLIGHGFDFLDYNRLMHVPSKHFDKMHELWLDGYLIAKWSQFSFKHDDNKIVGTFDFIEL